MKITTKKGDGGETGLFDGTRIAKSADLIEVIGEIDELQAFLGMVRVLDDFDGAILRVQDELYRVMAYFGGCDLKLGEETVGFLECDIEAFDVNLREFVRPGESELEARLQVCRAVCRRVERRVCSLGDVDELVLRYFNRLSDWLFVLGLKK